MYTSSLGSFVIICDSEDFYFLTNKLLNELKFFLSKNSEKIYHGFYKNIKLVSTLIIIIHVSRSPKQHSKMVSEGSRNTEDWSNGR